MAAQGLIGESAGSAGSPQLHLGTYAVRAQMWDRIRRGCYTEAHRWWSLDEVGRHRLRTRAVLVSLDSPVAVSHVSAAVEHGVATWGVSLDRIHVTRLDGAAGRIEGDVVHHVGRYRPVDLVDRGGMLMPSPTRSVLETAITASAEAGLVHLDSLLNLELADEDDLCAHRHMVCSGSSTAGSSTAEVSVQPEESVREVTFAERQREDALREATQFRMVRRSGPISKGRISRRRACDVCCGRLARTVDLARVAWILSFIWVPR